MNIPSAKPRIIIICGPTAIGKTTAGIEAAGNFGGQIISADSMQIYRRMDIGTAKPTLAEKSRIPHHLVDIVEPNETFDAAQYSQLARRKVWELVADGIVPFVVGGTGLYIKALTSGIFEAESPAPALRQRLKKQIDEKGAERLHQTLQHRDPETAARIHPNDTYRIVRALEIIETTGRSLTDWQNRHRFEDQPFETFKIGLQMEREILYERINRRVDIMLQKGLLVEVKSLLETGCDPGLKSMQSIGYRHMVAFINGELSWDEATRTLKRDTRHYAKRQMTWFRGDPEIIWTEPQKVTQCYPLIERFLSP